MLYSQKPRCELPLMKFAAAMLLAAAAVLGLAGCLPTSTNPLSSPTDAIADNRLDGVWYGKSGEDTVFLHFVPDEQGMTDIAEVDHEQGKGAHSTIYTMFPTVIDGQHYMNIREKKANGTSDYYFARYTLSDTGTLTLWLMGEKAVTKAIKADKLAGKVKASGEGAAQTTDVTITASSEALVAFVRKSDPATLFSEKFGVFKKVTLPVLPAATPTPSPSPTPAKKKTPATPTKKKKATN